MNATVHLAGLRCDGSAHDGCEAYCNLYWKDAWLAPVDATQPTTWPTQAPPACSGGCTEPQLRDSVRAPPASGEPEDRYVCQATVLYEATQPLAWWDIRQYVFDAWTRNRSAAFVMRVLFLAALRALLKRIPVGYRFFRTFHDGMHRKLTGRAAPALCGRIPAQTPTPVGSLGLAAGEWVRIKSQAEIEQTIDSRGRNRGLTFDPEEMAPYCGGTFKVRKSVKSIIDERTGKMLRMKQPCIILDGVVCKSLYAGNRLNCPREFPSFWRELWLERVARTEPPGPPTRDATS